MGGLRPTVYVGLISTMTLLVEYENIVVSRFSYCLRFHLFSVVPAPACRTRCEAYLLTFCVAAYSP